MASQSPDEELGGEESVDKYKGAWAAIRTLTLDQGASWSGNELNCSYLNTGDGRFVNISAISGAEFIDDARSVVSVDWDNDGDLDMIVKNRTAPRVRILRNDYGGGGHFLAVELRATTGHPDAIGAQVVVQAGGKPHTQRIYCGDGFLSQRSRRLHFGLGKAPDITRLTVNWPDGSSEVHEGLELDSFIRITQGQREVKSLNVGRGRIFRRSPSRTLLNPKQQVTRVPLVAKLPLGFMPLPSFANPERVINDLSGRPVLINLWASWCAGCLTELGEFKEYASKLKRSGLQIVPMTTDTVDDRAAASAILEEHGLGELSGAVDETLMKAFELLLVEVLGKQEPLPLPASFLLDQAGQLVAIYLGPVDPETLLKDLRRLKRMNPARNMDAQLFGGGRWAVQTGRQLRLLARSFRALGYGELGRVLMLIADAR